MVFPYRGSSYLHPFRHLSQPVLLDRRTYVLAILTPESLKGKGLGFRVLGQGLGVGRGLPGCGGAVFGVVGLSVLSWAFWNTGGL